ncbi:hypothetical protein ACTFIU_010620 [Dictyostelium citrinum]
MSSSIPTQTKFDDKFGEVSESYKNFRPTYNDELYSIIDSYCDDKRDLAIDVGSGSGQATVKLAKYFKKVIGYEPSENQLKHAEPTETVEYRLSAAEKIDLPSGSVDLITVATAVHWFNLQEFYKESKRLLRENGSLIIWCYGILKIINNEELQKIHDNIYSNILRHYWAPEIKYIQDGYVDIKPTYENTTRKTITLEKMMSINDMIGMYSSWSSYAKYIKEGNKDFLPDIKKSLIDLLKTTDCFSKIIKLSLLLIKRILDTEKHIHHQSNINYIQSIYTLITFYDFNKAFDSISHKSISRKLEHIGIPHRFTAILLNLLKETKNKIKINDFLVNGITIRRGTKQGDPISPTIFALVLEPLLIDIINDNTIKGFTLPNSKSLKLTAFADDIATFTNSTEEIMKINTKIQKYCSATSSSLNKEKTVMIAIGDKPHDLPFQESSVPERYLGLNFTKTGLNSKFNTLIQEMKNNLIKWKSQAITMKAKMAILKTYVLSKLTYHQYMDNLNEEQI